MALLGKILIFVNLTLSLVFAGWALGVYSQRLDWKDAEYMVGNERLKQKEAIDRLVKNRDQAEARWQAAHTALLNAERLRPRNQAWYKEQLKILETGKDDDGKEVNPPVQELARKADGQLIFTKQGRAEILYLGQPLQSIQAYNDRYSRTQQEIKDEQKVIEELIKEEIALTAQINGQEKPAPIKGLRQQLAEQQTALRNCVEEREYLQPLVYNRLAESQLLLKRQASLQARQKELQGVGVVTGGR